MKKRVKRFLVAPKTAVWLILLTFLASIAALTIPQSEFEDPAYFKKWSRESPWTYGLVSLLQLDRVFSSFWFILLASLLTVVLSYSVYLQFSTLVRGRSKDVRKWGGFIFHLGILVVVFSSFYAASFEARGMLELAEADTSMGGEEEFQAREHGFLAGRFDPGFRVRLDRFHHGYYEGGSVKDLKSDITLIDNGNEIKGTVGINRPLDYKGVRIYQLYYRGYALSFLVRSDKDAYYVYYSLGAPERPEEAYRGESDIPETPYIVRMEFRPDIKKKSFHIDRPTLKLTVELRGKAQFQGVISPGGEVVLPGGERLKWVGIRNWCALNLVKSSSTPFAIAGLWIMIVGAVLLYAMPEKRIE